MVKIVETRSLQLLPKEKMRVSSFPHILVIGIVSGSGRVRDLETKKEYILNDKLDSPNMEIVRLKGKNYIISASKKEALDIVLMSVDLI